MQKVSLCLYDDRYLDDLKRLLEEFQKEVYGISTEFNIIEFVNGHHGFIYLVMSAEGTPVGFTSFVYNSYYGLREATLGNDYIYIMKAYRRTRAMHLISIQAGVLCQNNNIPLEHYYASDESSRFMGRMKGERIFSTYIFPIEEVSKETERLQTKVRIKK